MKINNFRLKKARLAVREIWQISQPLTPKHLGESPLCLVTLASV